MACLNVEQHGPPQRALSTGYRRLLNDRRRYQEMRRGTQRPGRSREKKSMPLLLTTQVYKKKIKTAQVELTLASDDANTIDNFLKTFQYIYFYIYIYIIN